MSKERSKKEEDTRILSMDAEVEYGALSTSEVPTSREATHSLNAHAHAPHVVEVRDQVI